MSKSEITALLQARNALIVVLTTEEGRAERSLIEAITAAKYGVRLQDCVSGVTDAAGKEVSPGRAGVDPAATLAAIRDTPDRAVWIMRDLHAWWKDPTVCRALRNLARALQIAPRSEARAIIVTAPPSTEIPPELADHAIVVRWTLPGRDEIGDIFDTALAPLEALPDGERQEAIAAARAVREDAIDAAIGLTAEGAASCYARSLVMQKRRMVPSVIAAEKKRVISGKGLEWIDPDPRGIDAIGGYSPLKAEIRLWGASFTPAARAYGLPTPRGVILVGVPGCGKSLLAKGLAAAWQCPLLRGDLGGAKSKWVGESEANIRAMFAIAEKIGRCVLWFDEIEKMLGGATQGAADGGVSSDALGVFLSWLQDRKGEVFVIATANDVSKLPPELLRAGRFDDLFFVDLPTVAERSQILAVTLAQAKRDAGAFDLATVARACAGFSGAEVAAIVGKALRAGFTDGAREITTTDLIDAARSTVPQSKRDAEKITALRTWAQGNARRANDPEVAEASNGARALDI